MRALTAAATTGKMQGCIPGVQRHLSPSVPGRRIDASASAAENRSLVLTGTAR